ncbi:MAG: hypothetical protein SFV23_11685 [Planctomycetaceae bacterium]|nr:hypothetical protein [Planctomycetaceae bacterium]
MTGGIVIQETDAITLGGVNGTLGGVDVTTSGNIVVTADGSITVSEGVSGPDALSFTALGATSDLTVLLNSGFTSTDGNILLTADRTVTISEDVSTTAAGTLAVTGNGAAGARNIVVDSGAVVSTVNGNLTLDADQGTTQSGNFAGILVTGAGTEVRVTGTGSLSLVGRGGDGAAGNQYGVASQSGGAVSGGAGGTVTVDGAGGAGNFSYGVYVNGAGSAITSSGGALQITGSEGGGSGSFGIVVEGGGAMTHSANGDVTLIANSMSFDGSSNIGAGTGAVMLLQLTSGVAIDLGAAADTVGGPLAFSDAELDRITAGELQIGDANSGAITVSSDITLTNNAPVLCLTTDSTVTATAGGIIVSDLAITAGGAVTITDDSNDVDQVAITTTTGNVTFEDADGFTAGGVCSVDGIRTDAGSVTLVADAGNITVTNTAAAMDIAATTGITITLSANDALFTVNGGANLTNSTSNGVSISADAMSLGGTIAAASQTVTLQNSAGADAIDLGSATDNAADTLELSDAELDGITANKLVIGSAPTGAITVTSDIDLTDNVPTLRLNTGGTVTAAAGGVVVSDLAIVSADAVTFTDATTDVTNLAIDAATGNVRFTAANGLTITTIDGVTGIDNDGGAVRVDVTAGNLTIADTTAANDIDAAGAITLTVAANDGLFAVNSGAVVNTTAGGVTVSADKMNLAGSISAVGQTVTLYNSVGADAIDLGSAIDNQANTLELSDAELDRLTADLLVIGSATTGSVTVSSDISLTDSQVIPTLHVITNNGVTGTAGGLVVANLAISANGPIDITDADNDVDQLAVINSGSTTFSDKDDLTIGSVDGLLGVASNGGEVVISAAGELTVNEDISTTPGAGGVITVTGGTLNAELIAGAGDITLTGGNPDLIVNVAQTTATTLTLQATRDVILNAVVSTTGSGADVLVTADLDHNGVGGVQVAMIGQVVSADAIALSGSDLFATAMSSDSIRIDADGVNDQLRAGGDILLQHQSNAPVTADILIEGRIHSTGGDITVNARDTIRATSVLQADAVTGDITFQDALILTGDLLVNSGGNAAFQSTINDDAMGGTSSDLTITAAGDATFFGDVGGNSALESLTTNGGGTTVVDTASVRAGILDFQENVTIAETTTVTGTTSVNVEGTITGSAATVTLTVVSSGAAGFAAAISSLDDLTVNAGGVTTFEGNISIGGDLSTIGGDVTRIDATSIAAGTVSISDALELRQDLSITAGRMTFGGTVNEAAGASGSDLTLTITNPGAAAGDITFGNAVGGTTALDSLTIATANDVAFQSTVRLVGDLIQQAGVGTTAFNGTSGTGIGGQLLVTTNAVTFSTADVVTVGAVNVQAQNNILFNANAGLNAGGSTIALRANQDGAGSEGFSQASGTILQTTNNTTSAVVIAVGGTLGDAAISDVRAGTTLGVVSITAGDEIRDNSAGEGANVTAHAAVLRAGMGIGVGTGGTVDVDTDVNELAFSSTGAGVNVSNLGDLTLKAVDGLTTSLAFGGGTLFASGSLTVAMSTQVGGTFNFIAGDDAAVINDLTLSADIAHLTGQGEIYFQAGDDIIQTAGAIVCIRPMAGSLSRVNFTADHEASGADGDRGGITQSGGSILATEVQLRAFDAVLLDQATNDVDILAAVVTGVGQSFTFRDADNLTIFRIDGVGGVVGLTTNAGDVAITTGGQLILGGSGEDILAAGATVSLNVGNGFNEGAGSTITAANLLLQGTGVFHVTQQNQLNVLAANINGTLAYTDADGLSVGTVSGVVGITTTSDDVRLTTTSGNLVLNDDIMLGAGDLTLNVTGTVTQATGDVITANGLQILGSGAVSLDDANNDVSFLSISHSGAVSYRDQNALTIGTVSDTSIGTTTTNGITNAADVKLTTGGNLTIGDGTGTNDDITITGGNDLTLNVTGAVTQLAGNVLTASGLQLLGAGTMTLTQAANNVVTIAATYSGDIAYVDADALVIGVVADDAAASMQSSTGVASNGGEVVINAAGELTVNEDISSTPGAGGLITVTGGTLNAELIAGAGDITLTGGNPDLIINVAQTTATTLTLQATRDVIVNAVVSTTGTGADVLVSADLDHNGVGGVQVTAIGQVVSADGITLTGSDLFATAMSSDSLRVDADGVNDQLRAVGDIVLQHQAGAPMTADIVIEGRIHSTGGDITVNARDTILATSVFQADAVTGDITFQDALILTGDLLVNSGGNAAFQSVVDTVDFDFTAGAGTGGNLTFEQAVTGGGHLTVLDGDVIRFEDIIQVDDLTIQDASTSVTFVDAVDVMNYVSVTSGGNITQQSTLDAGNDVVLLATGAISIQGELSANSDVSLTSSSASITANAAIDAVNGSLTASAGTTLSAAQALNAGNRVDLNAASLLTLAEAADITAGGGGVSLEAMQIVTAAEITTVDGDVAITGAMRLTGDVTIDTGASGDLAVSGAIDGTIDFSESLYLSTSAGDITVTGNVGSTTELNEIVIGDADDVTFAAAISAERLLQQSGSGATTIMGAVHTFGAEGIQLTTSSIQFSAVSASMDSHGNVIVLTADAVTLPTTWTNALGSTVTLQTLTAGTSIGLEDASQDLNFTDAQLDTIHSATLVIGSATQIAGIKVGTDGEVSIDENLTLLTADAVEVTGPLSATTSNSILLDAGADISVTGSIAALSGTLTLSADDDITLGSAALIQSAGGDVTLLADADLNADGFGGGITMTDGAVVNSGTGRLTMRADEAIVIGQVISDNATASAVGITSVHGGIVDGCDAGVDIVLTSADGVVTINAVTGVGGVAGLAADVAIETQVNQIRIVNSSSGDIAIDEVDAMTVLGVNQTGMGAATLTSGGTMIVASGGPGVQTQGGGVALVTIGAASDLVLNAEVTSRGGDVFLTVGDDLTQAVSAPLSSGGGDLTLDVAGDTMLAGTVTTGGGDVTAMIDGNLNQTVAAPITTAGGGLDITVGGDTTLTGSVASGGGDVILDLAGSLTQFVTAPITTAGGSVQAAVGGDMVLSASLTTAGGSVMLDVGGDATILATAPISTSGGAVTAMIDGTLNLASVVTTAAADINLTIGGDVNLAATAQMLTADGDLDAVATGDVTMTDGSVINTSLGTLSLQAGGDITVGQLITTNSTGAAMLIRSTGGAIRDGGDAGGPDILANSAGAVTTMEAANGVGSTTGAGSDAALETQIDLVILRNADAGSVQLDEADALRVRELTQSADGSVTVTSVGDLLLVAGQPGLTATSGTVSLHATAATSKITVDSNVQTTSADVLITAADAVRFGSAARVLSQSGDVTVIADADNSVHGSGGEFLMTNGAVINSGSGDITARADMNITIGQLVTTGTVSLTSTSAGVVDGGDAGGADIIAETLVIQTRAGIGSTNALETAVSLFAANNTTFGAIRVHNNTGGLLTVGQVGSIIGVNNAGAAAQVVDIVNHGGITVNGAVRNSTGGDIELTATANGGSDDHLTVNAVIAATGGNGDVRLTAGDDLILNDSGNGGGDDITVVNGGEILGSAGGDVIFESNVVVRSATGAVTNIEPILMDVLFPQVSALGIGTVTMTVQRPLEVGTVVMINWGDGTIETFVVTDEGQTTLVFNHQYVGPPNPANPAADIPIRITVINPAFTSGAAPSPTEGAVLVRNAPYVPNIRFAAGGEVLSPVQVGDLNQTTVFGVLKTPGDGLASFAFDLTPPVVPLVFPQPSTPDASLLSVPQPPAQANMVDSATAQAEELQGDVRVVLLEIIGPDGAVQQTVTLSEDVLDDIDPVVEELPDGRYRFLLREPGESQTRLLQMVEVREGKIADELDSSLDRPRSLRIRASEGDQMPAAAGSMPDVVEPAVDAQKPENLAEERAEADVPVRSWRGPRAWRLAQEAAETGDGSPGESSHAAAHSAGSEEESGEPLWEAAAAGPSVAMLVRGGFGRAARLFRKYGARG